MMATGSEKQGGVYVALTKHYVKLAMASVGHEITRMRSKE